MPTYWLENLSTILPISPVCAFYLTRSAAKHIKNEIDNDHAAMCVPSRTQTRGAPLLSVMSNAYICVVAASIDRIGAKVNVAFAASTAASKGNFSQRNCHH